MYDLSYAARYHQQVLLDDAQQRWLARPTRPAPGRSLLSLVGTAAVNLEHHMIAIGRVIEGHARRPGLHSTRPRTV